MKNRGTIILALAALAFFIVSSNLWSKSVTIGAYAVLISILAIWPFLVWLALGGKHLPVVEVYCAMHVPGVVMPLLSVQERVFVYRTESIARVCIVVVVYLMILEAIASFLIWRRIRAGFYRSRVLDRQLPEAKTDTVAWMLLAVWWVGTALICFQAFPDLGGLLRPIFTFIDIAGKIALFLLFYRVGLGSLRGTAFVVLGFVGISQSLLSLSSGFLSSCSANLVVSLVAYSTGRRRIPFVAILIVFLILGFLHLGKGAVRTRYWLEDANYSATRPNLVELFNVWIAASWAALGDAGIKGEQVNQSLVERASVVQWIVKVIDETPNRRSFLEGETYRMIVPMFIPRFFWPDKPRASAPTERLAIYYGVQTEQSTETTAIGMGQVAEAWANFGWYGVIGIGACMGMILSLGFRLGYGRSPLSVGYVLGLPLWNAGFGLEICVGPLLHALMLHTLILGLVLLFITQPPAKANDMPFDRFRGLMKVRGKSIKRRQTSCTRNLNVGL